MFYLGGVGLAVFLDLLLLAKRRKSRADWVLACWLLIIALHLSMFTFFRLNLYPQLLGLDLPLPLLHGPFLYLYTRELTGSQGFFKHLLMHMALPLSFYIYLIPFILLPVGEKIFVYENEGIGYEAFLLIRAAFIPASGIVYIFLSLLALRRHRGTIVEQFSSVDKVNLVWLRNLIIGLSVIWALVLIGDDDWIFGATVVFTFFIGFFGIRQGVIFSSRLPGVEPGEGTMIAKTTAAEINAQTRSAKYQKSGLSPASSEALHHQLTALMAGEKLYRNSEFSLAELAERLNAPPNHVSQVINEREGKNFYDYVNSLRIQEFMAIAHAPGSRNLTLFGLAQQCGFNSKSSFNRYFKKITGQLPSEYMADVMVSQN